MNARRSISWRRLLLLAAFLATAVGAATCAGGVPSRLAHCARARSFSSAPGRRTTKRVPKGDGLGPLFNADSCIACHAQGGVGGAGPNGVNVQLMTVTAALRNPRPLRQPCRRGFKRSTRRSSAHPARSIPPIVLHRHSTGRGYSVWREDLLRLKNDGQRELDPLLRLFPMQALTMFITRERQHSPRSIPLATDGLEFEITERNTPALVWRGAH